MTGTKLECDVRSMSNQKVTRFTIHDSADESRRDHCFSTSSHLEIPDDVRWQGHQQEVCQDVRDSYIVPESALRLMCQLEGRGQLRSRLTILMHCAVTIAQEFGRWHSKATPKRATMAHTEMTMESPLPHIRWRTSGVSSVM